MKKIYIVIIGIVLAILLGCGIGYGLYSNAIKKVSNNEDTLVLTVAEGMTQSDVVNELAELGLIKSTFFTNVFLKLNDFSHTQVNKYRLNQTMSVEEIFTIITTGDTDYIVGDSFTIYEGVTIPQVASVIAEKIGITQEEVVTFWSNKDYLNSLIAQYEFLDDSILADGILYPLEGYLYPETYNIVGVEKNIESYTKLMLDYAEVIYSKYYDQIKERGFTVHQFLTFVSVVERESLYQDDKVMIASVFYNRLAVDMKLQSDITVLYALKRTGLDVSYEDLEIESPYNTYLHTGLPIGPISNVYEKTIEACLNPATTDYYFFFALKDGTVLYAKTYEEHEKNVEENMWY